MARQGAGGGLVPETVEYSKGLFGYIYKPPTGSDPFPAMIGNHGSEQNPLSGQIAAKFWVDRGFVFFFPHRSGQGLSAAAGPYIGDEQKEMRESGIRGRVAFPQTVALHEKANNDVVAAVKWLKTQNYINPQKIVMTGGSYGGIQTLLTAERNAKESLGIVCFIPMGPAAQSWNPGWGERLTQAVKNSNAPIFLMQAQNDYNLGPSEVVGPVIDAKGSNRHKVYPVHVVPGMDPSDHRAGHGAFFHDDSVWGDDVLAFLKDCHEI
jgi:dienelactone hydrolase